MGCWWDEHYRSLIGNGTTCHVVKDGAKVLVPARHAASHITELADLADVRAAFANQYGPDYMERIADDLQRFTR